MSDIRQNTRVAEAVMRGFTHLQARCGAPNPGPGYCGNVTLIPWNLLPGGVVARNPFIAEFRPMLRCRKCGLKGYAIVEAWKQERPR